MVTVKKKQMEKLKNTFKKVTPTEKMFSWTSSLSIRESNGKLLRTISGAIFQSPLKHLR